MQIVIEIPKEELTCDVCPCFDDANGFCNLWYAIYGNFKIDCCYKGRPIKCPAMPLPKGHGGLIDVNKVVDELENLVCDKDFVMYNMGVCDAFIRIKTADIIISTDKEVANEDNQSN